MAAQPQTPPAAAPAAWVASPSGPPPQMSQAGKLGPVSHGIAPYVWDPADLPTFILFAVLIGLLAMGWRSVFRRRRKRVGAPV